MIDAAGPACGRGRPGEVVVGGGCYWEDPPVGPGPAHPADEE